MYGKVYARNPDGSLVLTQIDEKTLRQIAGATGGEYFRATDAEALAQIYAQILELERTKFQVKEFERVQEYFRYAAIPAVLLILLELLRRVFTRSSAKHSRAKKAVRAYHIYSLRTSRLTAVLASWSA